MSSDAVHDQSSPAPHSAQAFAAPTTAAAVAATRTSSPVVLYLVGAVAVVALVGSGMLWQRLSSIQEQLARQSADSGTQAIEARTMARDAQDVARDSAARISVMEARVGEVALQRTQLEELIQGMSRTRDETLVVDIDAAIRMAQQQALLTGSPEPLVAALRSAAQRIERTAQPRLTPVQHAIERDLEGLSRLAVTDTAGLLTRLDDLLRSVDDLRLLNAVATPGAWKNNRASAAPQPSPEPDAALSPTDWAWWQAWGARGWDVVREEAYDLVRVSRIDQPEAVLLSPDQGFFLRENLKLTLLNARLGVLARQFDAARADLTTASNAIGKYFDPASRRTQQAQAQLLQIQSHLKNNEPPSLDETLAALATAAAGR
ncbi:uroporphyrinogen-III C-methyltransferase [Acidovorax sp. Be4]|uniref:Uroporphyrinogen-III C-methyltransferase n=1 Tax=Acidovorax bellezanensis TaxID=2976702 RepID=A0ABT2PKY6_9BURK|nr:uroporphyrinogen-III C-methyltransferase [Acidovorax sp. Be4]MCT9809768.1 uroporphyrinogen-III C-methyltransferase [Acidovorax sp. Be4]